MPNVSDCYTVAFTQLTVNCSLTRTTLKYVETIIGKVECMPLKRCP